MSTVLCYLRHSCYPLFWDKHNGFDFVMYHRLRVQADFFGVTALAQWISDGRYLECVKTEISWDILVYRDEDGEQCHLGLTSKSGVEKRMVNVSAGNRREYVCPRGIPVHSEAQQCGRQCRNLEADASKCYVDFGVHRVVFETKKLVVDFGKLYNNVTKPLE